MVTKIVNADIDMYGNRVVNLCVEVLPELPETAKDGRLVYLAAARQIFVYNEGSWQTVGELNPTKLSAFENDVGYLTADTVGLDNYYTKEETDRKIDELSRLEFKVMDALPETGESNFIYLVPSMSSKAKNVKDEWIWVDGDWELIGSTSFKLDIIQSEDGIIINDKTLQKATETQDGLMTREMVKEFRGKQDKLTAGPNISIENGVISAIGGGTGGGHASFVGSFGGDGGTSYPVKHDLGTYNIIFQMRTAPPVRYVQSTVYADDENTLRIEFSEPLYDIIHISILACDASAPEPGEVLDIDVKEITTPQAIWTHANPTGQAVYCQLFDTEGNEIGAEMVQNSADGFDPVVATLGQSSAGYMLVAKATLMYPFEKDPDLADDSERSIVVNMTDYGCTSDDRFLVQVFMDGAGQNNADIEQANGTITANFGNNISGYLIIRKATLWQPFTGLTGEAVTISHGLGRIVGAQVYSDEFGLVGTDMDCIDENTFVANPVTGTGFIVIL